MYVTHLESGTVTAQSSGSQSGKTSLMGQLAQRVILIHELGQLGGTEEFLHRRLYGLDVDQHLRRDLLRVMSGHALADHSLHSGKADAVLVLQKLAHRTDPAVAQMVDIIVVSDAVLQMDVIVNGSQNVFLGNMLRDQLMDVLTDRLRKLLRISGMLIQNFLQLRIIYQLRHAKLSRIAVHIMGNINHHAGKDLHIPFLSLHIDIGNRRVLDLVRQLRRHLRPGRRDQLSRRGIHHILRQHKAADPVLQHQLLIKFISADLGQVISSGVEEHGVDQALRALHA